MIQVYIVEDKPRIRAAVEKAVNMQNDMECKKTFSNAEDAINRFMLEKPQVIIMDIKLSTDRTRLNGIECMVQVKKKHPNSLVLMFTTFDHEETLFEALRTGADGYILKKDSIPGIVEAIREAVDGGAPMSRSIAKKIIEFFHQAPKNPPTPLPDLSDRQLQVLGLVAKGLPNKLIADQLNIALGTVKQHLSKIYQILQVNNRTEAILKYQESLQKLESFNKNK